MICDPIYPEVNREYGRITEQKWHSLMREVVTECRRILKPKGYLLAFFHSDDRVATVPCYIFRIEDIRTLQVCEYAKRAPSQLFNNRRMEKLFQNFESVKFFLTRERLREVIVRK